MPDGLEVTVDESLVDEDGNVAELEEGQEQAEEQQEKQEGQKKLAGKFDSADDLEKGYLELQKKLSQRGTIETDDSEEGEEAPEAPPARADGTIDTGDEAAEKVADEQGINLDTVVDEFADKGEVGEKTYAALEAKGLSRQQVDTYLAGQAALADAGVKALQKEVGGEEVFNELLNWARTGLDSAEVQAYNEAINSGNQTMAKMLLRGMKAQYDAAEGVDPDFVEGETVPGAKGAKPFTSEEGVAEAMGNPKYGKDAAYTRKVDDRIAVTSFGSF